jgi:hypothetical protein
MPAATGSPSLLRNLAWLLASGSAVCAAAVLALALVGTVDMLMIHSKAGDFAHGLELSVDLLVWALFGAGGVAVASLLLSPPVRWSWSAFTVALIGVMIAMTLQLALHHWAAGRQIDFDPEYLGVTILAPGLLVAVATACFAVFQAPKEVRPLVQFVGLGAALILVAAVATNLPGARDGIKEGSRVLALVLATSVAYALVGAVYIVRARS